MTEQGEIFLPSLGRSFQLKRRIGSLGDGEGPVLIFFGSIHGNEQFGMAALCDVFEEFGNYHGKLHGRAYAFTGNMRALKKGQRFMDTDLNRLWSDEQIERIQHDGLNGSAIRDELEQLELLDEISEVIHREKGPFMFFDLHTTSASSSPFILINDTLINRYLADSFPHRIILGIEEYLEGPLLSYINDQGFASLGFESGQHEDPKSFELHKKFIIQSFLVSGFLWDEKMYKELIADERRSSHAHTFFQVRHCYRVRPDEEFRMDPGYLNFSPVHKAQTVARNKYGVIQVKESGYLFMPLYQTKGGEGFFLIKLIPNFWLQFSSFLRKIDFDRILLALPGIKRHDKRFKSLEVNERVARFLARDLLHLLGYRRSFHSGSKRIYIKREFTRHQLSLFNHGQGNRLSGSAFNINH